MAKTRASAVRFWLVFLTTRAPRRWFRCWWVGHGPFYDSVCMTCGKDTEHRWPPW